MTDEGRVTLHDAYVGTCDGFGYGDAPPGLQYYRYCGYCSCGWATPPYMRQKAHRAVAGHLARGAVA